jgi:hypothetical protein
MTDRCMADRCMIDPAACGSGDPSFERRSYSSIAMILSDRRIAAR